jgi:hypothetical protein
MSQDSGFDIGVSTINPNIQHLLSERDYKPSYITKLINRAIEDKRYVTYSSYDGLRKGHFVQNNEAFHEFLEANVEININGKEITYPCLTMPSPLGSGIVEELDTLVTKFKPDSLNEDAFYSLLAMMVVSIGSAHAFPDGSGRTAIGVADVYIRKYLHKQLDRTKLEQFDKRLTTAMTTGSLLMLPSEYNPNSILKEMKSSENRIVTIPSSKTHTVKEVYNFAEEYLYSIISNISKFNPNNITDTNQESFSMSTYSITPIATLLRECTV